MGSLARVRLSATLFALLAFALGCEDTEGPRWSAGELEVAESGADRVEVRWPLASDEALAGHLVYVNGVEVARLGAEARSFEVTELEEASTVRISVDAFDAAGNYSERLHVQAETTDGSAPRWGRAAPLTASPTADGSELRWVPAEDNVEVRGYRIYRDAAIVAELDPGVTNYSWSGALAGVSLTAVDAAGNESARIEPVEAEAAAEPSDEPDEGAASGDAVEEAREAVAASASTEIMQAPPHLRAPLEAALRGRSPALQHMIDQQERRLPPGLLRELTTPTGEHVSVPGDPAE